MKTNNSKKKAPQNKLFELKIKTPNLILFLKGFWDAKVTKTAGFNAETGLIFSPYFDSMENNYLSYSHVRIKEIEEELFSYRQNATLIISRDYNCTKKIADLESKIQSTTHQYNARDMDRFLDSKEKSVQVHLADIEELSKTSEKIYEEESLLIEEFLAIAKKIESMFVVYATGMLLRYSLNKCIPHLNASKAFDTYRSRYVDRDEIINNYLKEGSHV